MSLESLEDSLAQVYGEPVALRGPYLCKDGRLRVDLRTGEGVKTHQLARVVLEVKIARRLEHWETVDHINDDKTDNAPSNLQVLSLEENASKSVKRIYSVQGECVWCGEKVTLSRGQREPRAAKKAGPFCSRKCSGGYGAAVRKGPVEVTSRSLPPKVYWKKV